MKPKLAKIDGGHWGHILTRIDSCFWPSMMNSRDPERIITMAANRQKSISVKIKAIVVQLTMSLSSATIWLDVQYLAIYSNQNLTK